jgi:hypothetical protein
LGYKSIKNTIVYVHLAEELFEGEQEYVSKVAKNTADTCALVEAGFEYVCGFNSIRKILANFEISSIATLLSLAKTIHFRLCCLRAMLKLQ